MPKKSPETKNVRRVLIVEDDALLAATVRQRLEKLSFSVEVAGNGAEGLAAAKARHPDIVILDLMLPVMNGFDVLRSLKEDEKMRKTPVLILTSLSDADNVRRSEGLGADGYLVKPEVSLQGIAHAVQNLLESATS